MPTSRTFSGGNAVLAVVTALVLLASSCAADDEPDAADATSTTAEASGALWSGPMPNTRAMSQEDSLAIDEAAESAMQQADGQVPGMWIGVWDSSTGKHLGAYGNAVLEGSAAATDQIGRIGSVTMSFTAAAVLQQVGEGRTALTDTIEDLLPDLAKDHPDVADITVEQLLGMTSGIPDYADSDWFLRELAQDPTRVWSPGEIIDAVLSRGDLAPAGTPGYSTTNYLVLGEMLEGLEEGDGEISSILTTLAENAGLTRTAMPVASDATLPDPHSNGYVTRIGTEQLAKVGASVAAGTDVTDWSPSWGGAGGAMYSDLEDLGTWAAAGLGTNLLTRSMGARRIDDTEELPEVGEYGLGVQVWGNGWIGHSGRIVGWEALVAYNTDTGDVFTAIVNGTGSLVAAIDVVFEVFPELGESLL